MDKKYQIIALDDQNDILDVFKELYEDKEHEVICFNSTDDAITHIKAHAKKVVLIISDYHMPNKTGFDFKQELNSLSLDIPFVMITAYYDKEMALFGMGIGINYFLSKPLTNPELPEQVREHITRRKAHLQEEFEMISSFLVESSPMLEEIEDLILALESDPNDEQTLKTYYRLLHTIKGTASCVGLVEIPEFVHEYENLIGRIKNGEVKVDSNITNILLKGLDSLKTLYSNAQNGIISNDIEERKSIFTIVPANDDKILKICEEPLETQKTKQPETKHSEEGDKKENRISVDMGLLDSFMELSGELTVLRNTIMKAANNLSDKIKGDKDLAIMTDAIEEMHKVSSLLQTDISELRKVQVDTIFRPLKRVVRDSANSLKKSINFTTTGDDLRVDTVIGKILSNSLVHMIRNSIDHGIESSVARREKGKNPQGEISLSLREEGEFIVVDLIDDGNGLDLNRIKAKAIEKGLYKEEQLKHFSEQKIYSIIFESGFSTAQVVTDISGRGVGMDMVKSSVEKIGGKILITSELNKGTHFTIVLPIIKSVLIIKSLMVQIGLANYSIALDSVKEVVLINEETKDENLQKLKDSYFIKHHDELVPLVMIKNKFSSEGHTFKDIKKIVVVRADGYQYGIVVDEIYDIEEIVVKKLSPIVNSNVYFEGVTFVGDGDLALILNLTGIAKQYNISKQTNDDDEASNRFLQKKTEAEASKMELLLFDTWKTKNLALPLSAVHRLENIEVEQVEYSGDVAHINYRGTFLPLILTDQFIKTNTEFHKEVKDFYSGTMKVIVVQKNTKLIGLIVDEIKDIKEIENEINTNLVDREEIKGTVFINDRSISVINLDCLEPVAKKKLKTKEEEAELVFHIPKAA